jgi:hypothetical protein
MKSKKIIKYLTLIIIIIFKVALIGTKRGPKFEHIYIFFLCGVRQACALVQRMGDA